MTHKIEIKKIGEGNDTNYENAFINNLDVNNNTELGISDEGLVIIQNNKTSLYKILNELLIALNVFNASLASTDILAAPAATILATAVTSIQTELSGLLSPAI